MRYLLKAVDTYRVATVSDVEKLHDELLEDSTFDLVAFSYKTKYIKAKGEIIDEYFIVTLVKVFDDPRDPQGEASVSYQIGAF